MKNNEFRVAITAVDVHEFRTNGRTVPPRISRWLERSRNLIDTLPLPLRRNSVTRKLHLQHDWLPVVGETVEIRRGGGTVRTGVVDAVTTDGRVLWISADGAERRAMFERANGLTVWIEYKWESATSR
jgi:hypothetical protein